MRRGALSSRIRRKSQANEVQRPRYATIADELGLTKSMPASADQFEWRPGHGSGQSPTVFLGLGPEPDKLPEWFDLPPDKPVLYLESQTFMDQIDGYAARIPAHFIHISPDEFTATLAGEARAARYLPAHRAFPSFFAPLTARLTLGGRSRTRLDRTVWLPCGDSDLLVSELTAAFTAKGYSVRHMDHEALGKHPGAVLPDLLREGVPDLFFSVNFKGLDHYGLGYALLREAGAEVGVWLVDNPFNVLPSVRSGYWRDARLFVTDHSFIGPLIQAGARKVTHLPLAAAPALMDGTTLPDHARDLAGKLVFVGRSAFPDRDKFFAGETVPDEARSLVLGDNGTRRYDYHWWRDRLGVDALWPGNAGRAVGAGTEFASRAWKFRCLEAAGRITVFGDDGWHELDNPDADLRGPLDYYAHLPAVYREAAVTLNVTGLQLPAGLNQRNFDVWCAGGFLITDTHPGLSIFPPGLTEPIAYARPEEIHDLVIRYREDTRTRRDLQQAWRECILRDHTYESRAETILKTMRL